MEGERLSTWVTKAGVLLVALLAVLAIWQVAWVFNIYVWVLPPVLMLAGLAIQVYSSREGVRGVDVGTLDYLSVGLMLEGGFLACIFGRRALIPGVTAIIAGLLLLTVFKHTLIRRGLVDRSESDERFFL